MSTPSATDADAVDAVEDRTDAEQGVSGDGASTPSPALDPGDGSRALVRHLRAARRFLSSGSRRPWYRNRPAVAVLALLLVIVPAVIGLLVSQARPKVYAARAEVLFSAEDFVVDEATSETLALIGRSNRVLAPVAEAAGVSLADLQRSVSTSVVGTTTVVGLEVRRDDPEEATDLARAITEEWVAVARRPTTAVDAGLRAAIDVQTTRLGEIQAELSASDLSADRRASLEQDRDDLITRISQLNDDLSTLQGADLFLGHTAAILKQARVDRTPVEPQPMQAAIAGGVIGLLLAGALVAVAWQLTVRQ
jgi:hypothetical protein